MHGYTYVCLYVPYLLHLLMTRADGHAAAVNLLLIRDVCGSCGGVTCLRACLQVILVGPAAATRECALISTCTISNVHLSPVCNGCFLVLV